MQQKNLTLNPRTRNPANFPTSRMSELYKLSQNAQTYKPQINIWKTIILEACAHELNLILSVPTLYQLWFFCATSCWWSVWNLHVGQLASYCYYYCCYYSFFLSYCNLDLYKSLKGLSVERPFYRIGFISEKNYVWYMTQIWTNLNGFIYFLNK